MMNANEAMQNYGVDMTIDKTYKVGDTVRYEAFGGVLRTVKVTEKDEEAVNGVSGFNGTDVHTLQPVWGLDDQILRVFCQEQKRWK